MARASQQINRYSNMDFPDYEFQEYPKLVYPGAVSLAKPFTADAKPITGILVNDEEEEALALAGKEIVRPDDDRTELMTSMTQRGIVFDKRWGVAKLKAAVEAFEAEAA